MSTETEIDRMKRIPIEEFLARLGHSPVQRRTNALWYKAPYREERTASFKVNMERNLWYDYGLGKGGNIFALAGEFIHCDDFLSQVRYVAEVAGMPLPEKKVYHPCEVRRPVEPSFEDVELMPLQNRRCSATCRKGAYRRGWPSADAGRYTTPHTGSGILPWHSVTEGADMRYATASSRDACRPRM